MFDFQFCQIAGQFLIQIPDLEILHESYMSISAANELHSKKYFSSGFCIGYEYQQNYQIAISFQHQKRVKMMEF